MLFCLSVTDPHIVIKPNLPNIKKPANSDWLVLSK